MAPRQSAVAPDPGSADPRGVTVGGTEVVRPVRPAELIQRKRDGGELSPHEISDLILGFARGEIPDYQLAAFCMAVYFRGLSSAETFALTDAMIRSGRQIDLGAELGRKVVDKHSTGGVGDKTSLAVGPIVAACGVPFGKMSGRGLGHTGGTLDKLESIPGFRVDLTYEEFVSQVRQIGLAIIGQTEDLVPADKRLYALRDVTATVDNISLIAASIMSKKIAGGADAIVLDVKVGDGAFMKSLADARALAEAMLELGRHAGREVVCLLTDMDQPLGHAVGNALEVREAVATLRGAGPADFEELVVAASGRLLALSDLGVDEAEGRARAEQAIADGSALTAYERWIRAQGGDAAEDALPRAPVIRDLVAPTNGYVVRLGAIGVGLAALHLGAGRGAKDDAIDHAVGVVCRKKRGDDVHVGEPLAEIHAADVDAADAAAAEVRDAYELDSEPPPTAGIVLETIG
jgi:pyrimidine-nucleoside phosphorylase